MSAQSRLLPLPADVWHANELAHTLRPAVASGFGALDAQLPGGGWPTGALTELITHDCGIGELRLLVPLLRRVTAEHRAVVAVAPPHVPYAPALAAFGVDLDWLVVVHAAAARERLWAIEQALASAAAGAVLAWLPHGSVRPEQIRRLQLAAGATVGVAFVFRPLPARFQASPAPLRLVLQPLAGERLSVRIAKRQGPPVAQPLVLEVPVGPQAVALRHRQALTEPGEPARCATPALDTLMAPHPLLCAAAQGRAPLR